MARLRITTTHELEFVEGHRVAPGTLLLEGELAPVDAATVRVLLAQGTRMLRFEVLEDDAVPADEPLQGGASKSAPRRSQRKAAVNA